MSERISVLDKGFIELIDWMGNDLTVVNAARCSFGKESHSLMEKDERLIQRLIKDRHVNTLYHGQCSFRIKAPISVARQWYTHQVGTAFSSESSRYTEVKDEYYIPERIRAQSKDNKQGSDDSVCLNEEQDLLHSYIDACEFSFQTYKTLIGNGVAREQAREVLPLCTYVTFIFTASLMACLHFLELREDSHAQWEVRQYAVAMRELITPLFPVTLNAWRERAA